MLMYLDISAQIHLHSSIFHYSSFSREYLSDDFSHVVHLVYDEYKVIKRFKIDGHDHGVT